MLKGTGFPLDCRQNKMGMQVFFGDQKENHTCEIQSCNNTAIVCITPSYPYEQAVDITVSLKSNEIVVLTKYRYTISQTPKIISFSPKTSSPVLKTILTIKGTGFSGIINVLLTNTTDEKTRYECSVVQSTDSLIKCVLPGGKKGKYRLKVTVSGKGSCDYTNKTASDYDIFEYRIAIYSLSPNKGSILGGALLTIQGENFAPNSGQNQIALSNNFNELLICDIVNFNETTLQCRTRPASGLKESNFTVKVLSRLIETADCLDLKSGCLFNYSKDATPVVFNNGSNESKICIGGDILVLSGERLGNSSKVSLNQTECVILSQNYSSIVVKIPENTPFGKYSLRIYSEFFGFADVNGLMITINPTLLQFEPKVFYPAGGILTIQGSGFKLTPDFTIALAATDGKVIICTPLDEFTGTDIKCLTGALQEKMNYKISLKMSDTYFSCSICSFGNSFEQNNFSCIFKWNPTGN